MTYDSGNEHLDKLNTLIEDLNINENNYNSWETDFIENLSEQMQEFEIGDKNLTNGQKEKIEELYIQHGFVD